MVKTGGGGSKTGENGWMGLEMGGWRWKQGHCRQLVAKNSRIAVICSWKYPSDEGGAVVVIVFVFIVHP